MTKEKENEEKALRHYKGLTEEEKKNIPEEFFNKEQELIKTVAEQYGISEEAFQKLITYSRNDKIMAKDLLVLDLITDANFKYAKEISTKKRIKATEIQSLDKVASSTMKRMAYTNEQKRLLMEELQNEGKEEKEKVKKESNIKISF